jgi:hypothetical protein
MDFFLCPACSAPHESSGTISFREECASCAADLHVCLSCRFHDPYADNECRESIADPIAKKDRRNLCEYWKPAFEEAQMDDTQSDAAKAELAALFGMPTKTVPSSTPKSKEDALAKLNALFKKD